MDDLAFVHRFVKGEIPAREEFHKRYSRLIYNYILHVITVKGLKDYHDYIDDIYQGFFVFILEDDFRRLKAFKARNGCTFATWLRQLTINFTRDYLRRLKFAVSLDSETDEALSLKAFLEDDSLSVTDIISMEERIKVLDYCIELLSQEDKYFVELNFNQRISLEVLKDFFKVSRGAVDMHRARIVKRLRECFKSKGFLC